MANEHIPERSVVFLAEDHNWDRDQDNPLTCSGTLSDIEDRFSWVQWGNDRSNTYDHGDDDLIPMIQPTREAARAAAKRNRNLTVDKIGEVWVLKLKRKLVVADHSPRPEGQ